jgi:hypothetical protein
MSPFLPLQIPPKKFQEILEEAEKSFSLQAGAAGIV